MYFAGVDVGSLSSKAVIMENGTIKGWSLILTGPSSQESAVKSMNLSLEKCGLSLEQIDYIVSTGYGRVNVPFSQATLTEISCHARGNHWLFPEVRTILDVGGQDCKAIRCDQVGRLTDFALNDKCAAGTGRYLERVASALKLELGEIGPLSLKPMEGALPVSDYCAVFAERDINDYIRNGKHVNDVLAGAHNAIVSRIIALLRRVRVEPALCISGGLAKNVGVVKRLEKTLALKALIAPEPQIVGALGATLFAEDRAKAQRVQ